MTDDIFKFMRQRGVVRAREAVAAGFSRNRLADLARAGDIIRLSRGVYALPEMHLDRNFELVEVQKRIPHAVFCLIILRRGDPFIQVGEEAPPPIFPLVSS